VGRRSAPLQLSRQAAIEVLNKSLAVSIFLPDATALLELFCL